MYIFILPLLILIIILYPFLKIKINELETRAIGHFSISTEIFLGELKRNIHKEKNTIFLWFINKEVSNNFLLKKWKEKILIGPRFILKPLFQLINRFAILKFLKSPFRHWNDKNYKVWQISDIYNVLPKTKPNIVFKEQEKKFCNNYLKKFNSKTDKYICFFARTHHYRKDYIQLKDSNIKDQIQGIIKLCKKQNVKAFRIGSKHEKLSKLNKSIIDYSNSKFKSEMLDIYLPMNCKFMVGTSSGMDVIPALNRKKTLLVNKGDLFCLNLNNQSYTPLMLPKKFKKISNNQLIKYSSVFNLKLTEFMYEKDLNKFGYKSVENSPKEIELAIMEMNKLINSNKIKIKDTNLQNKFWEIFYKAYKIKKPSVLRISDSFLKINKNLIN